jgi:hypothetical protein
VAAVDDRRRRPASSFRPFRLCQKPPLQRWVSVLSLASPPGKHNRGCRSGSAIPRGLVEEDCKPTAKAVGYWQNPKVTLEMKARESP